MSDVSPGQITQDHAAPDQLLPAQAITHEPSQSVVVARLPAWVRTFPGLERSVVAITGVSIRTKIMGIMLALTLLLGLAVTLEARNMMSKALQAEFVVLGQLGEAQVELGIRLNVILQNVTDQMFFTTLVIAGIGIMAAFLLTSLITQPILDLVTATEKVRRGNLSVRAPHWTDDEIGELSNAFNQMVSELEASQQTVIDKENARTRLLSRLISAQEEERKRIARELHDGVGQTLTSILVHIKALGQSQDPATQARMAELSQLVDETLAGVRMLSRDLRPSALDDLGLEAALERYTAEFSVHYPNLEVDLHCALPQRLPANVETSLYRIIQEAMTNAARHSHGSMLSVVVTERSGAVHAIIEDNGAGFDVENIHRSGSSVGLHSMKERSELLNGALEIESSEEGTTIYVEIPLAEKPENGSASSEL